VRVVIADDSVLLREGAARLLEGAGIEVVAQASDSGDLLRKVRGHKPDVAIIDIRMPPDHTDDGLRAASTIRGELPQVGILILSQYVDEHYVKRLLAEGTEGVGYLLKDRVADVETFVGAVRRVANREAVLDPEVVAHMMGRRRPAGSLDTLTARERDVLAAMAEGLTNRAIAERLFLSERAIERHVTSIFEKLGLSAAEGGHRRVLSVLAFLQQ
jgi:DNA-binding NarL/FixJ family response regulator